MVNSFQKLGWVMVTVAACTMAACGGTTAETGCAENEWESSSASEADEALCTALTVCAEDQWESTTPSATSDRACATTTTCTEDEWESTTPSATTDRVCSEISPTCSWTEWESAAPSATSDRICTRLTVCKLDEREAVPPSPTSDRVCTAPTQCTEDEWETSPPSSSNDRICAALTQCTAGEWELIPATATSDRGCSPVGICAGGAADGILDPGEQCDAGANATLCTDGCTTRTLITSGRHGSCALTEAGVLRCWGRGGNGELGDGNATWFQSTPVPVLGFSGTSIGSVALAVSIGQEHACAIVATGAVRCWGRNNSGQLGEGSGSTDPEHTPIAVFGLDGATPGTTAVAIGTGYDHSCAAMKDGSVMCWGDDTFGQLGDDMTLEAKNAPVAVQGLDGASPNSTAVSVAAEGYSTCALLQTGRIQCWGNNTYGQLGNEGTSNTQGTPTDVSIIDGTTPSTTAIAVTRGRDHTCAQLKNGAVSCWGLDDNGQLGDSAALSNKTEPVTLPALDGTTPATTSVSVSANANESCAVLETGAVLCWGQDDVGQLGNDGFNSDAPTPSPVWSLDGTSADTTVVAVAVGGRHVCAVLGTGDAACWGHNDFGQMATGSTTVIESSVAITVQGFDGSSAASRAIGIAGGAGHSCAIDETGAVRCWGGTGNSLGYGRQVSQHLPVDVQGIDGSSPATSATAIAASYAHTCALLETGAASCWGTDSRGQLGDGGVNQSGDVPFEVSGLDGSSAAATAIAVTAGYHHTCALLETGAVSCWGANGFGELGDGTSDTDRGAPVGVVGIDGADADRTATAISAGDGQTCAILESGAVVCWGDNSTGQLGDGKVNPEESTPVLVSGFDGATAATSGAIISAGDAYTCAVTENGATYCWGSNIRGVLGGGTPGEQSTPQPVVGLDGSQANVTVVALGTGSQHACATVASGEVYCWGRGYEGQLGDGLGNSEKSSPVPALVFDGNSAATFSVLIDAGGTHNCSIHGNGALSCWGSDGGGQLGNDHRWRKGNSSRPEAVVGLPLLF